MITREEYLQLLPYENDFRRAVKAKYKLATPKEEDDLIISILLKYEPRTQVNRGCGNCMFRIYQRMGWKFYEFQEKCTIIHTESTSSTEQEDITSAKGGRKRNRKKTGDTKVVDEV